MGKKMKTDGNEIVLKMDIEDMAAVVNGYMCGLREMDCDLAVIMNGMDELMGRE